MDQVLHLLYDMQHSQSNTKYWIRFRISESKIVENESVTLCTLCGKSGQLRYECNKNAEAVKNNLTYLRKIDRKKFWKLVAPRKNLPHRQ